MTTHEEQGLDYSDMVSNTAMDTWPIEGRDVLRDGRYVRGTLLCNVVHDFGIITYSVQAGRKIESQHSDYAEARKAFNDL
ncbi:hypothetical protein O9X98_04325 [Agrobacterium salinitolerans]|nr:hypothetical protein [Agrobacterium salinitolerans]